MLRCFAALLALASVGLSQDGAAGATKPPAAPAADPPASSEMNAARLLPVGVPCRGLLMPDFRADLLISQIRVREMTRIDEQHLDMREMEVERYQPDGTLDYVVTVERGFYDLSVGRLTANSPTRLRGKAFDLQGQGCDYAPKAPVIKILGNVTSYFYPERADAPPLAPPAAEASSANPTP